MLGDYLRLVRLPNVFTIPSNILAGHFALVMPFHANALQLFLLVSSSMLIYISGIVFNDYFDIETDLKERPYRPLPSGRIAKRTAFTIGVASMISANLITFGSGLNSCIVSSLISAIVIVYDYKLKRTKAGPIAMGLARSLNVILGATPAEYLVLQNYNLLVRIIFISLSAFAYTFSISLLSRKEVQLYVDQKEQQKIIQTNRSAVAMSFSIVFGIIASFIFLVFLRIFNIQLFINLILFSVIMVIILLKQVRARYSSSSLQDGIKYMVIGIIVFDSVFITGVAGLYYGLSVLILGIPAVILSRRLYVT
ncbi:MAG: UbiA family prenyltransferase [Nitrososphaeraceae archaeon]